MKYKVGDKVRVRGDLSKNGDYETGAVSDMEEFRGRIGTIKKIIDGRYYKLDIDRAKWSWTRKMFRPTEFKIWCETEEEKQAVLEELEKERYMWTGDELKPTKTEITAPIGLSIWKAKWESDSTIKYTKNKEYFTLGDREKYICELTPSEFTGINFFEKIIITKTATGATATYGDKTVTTEGEFEDAARQALAEVLCPFKVGDRVKRKVGRTIGTITKINYVSEILVDVDDASINAFSDYELEPYTEPPYNAKLFCIKSSRNRAFKSGHIYKVENGVFTDMKEFGSDKPYKNFDDINKRLTAQFMEVLNN